METGSQTDAWMSDVFGHKSCFKYIKVCGFWRLLYAQENKFVIMKSYHDLKIWFKKAKKL